MTHPVIPPCYLQPALVSLPPSLFLPLAISLALALAPLLLGTSSDYLGALSLGGSTYGASVPATRLVSSACCLSSSFAFATSLSLPLVLSPRETVSLSFPTLLRSVFARLSLSCSL